MTQTRPRIAIIGAGPGGLALAVTIGKYSDLPVDLYEAGSEIPTVGAGIAFWTRSWEVMEELDLVGEMAKCGPSLTTVDRQRLYQDSMGFGRRKSDIFDTASSVSGPAFRRSDQPTAGIEFGGKVTPVTPITMHRALLTEVFKDSLPQTCTMHFSKCLLKYTSGADGAVVLHFADGTEATADVLVGADGVRSITRAIMFERLARESGEPEQQQKYRDCIPAQWAGTIIYRSLFSADKLREIEGDHRAFSAPICYSGKSKHAIAYPIAEKTLMNVAAFHTIPGGESTEYPGKWVEDASTQELLDCFAGWEPELLTLLSISEKPSKWAIHVVPALPFYVSGPVAIIGDAAHASTTHFGIGAGQAIEDAYILGRLLAHPRTTHTSIPQSLQIYSDIRQPIANRLVRESRLTGLMYEFNAPGLYDGQDRNENAQREGLQELVDAMREQWAWCEEPGIKRDWVSAEEKLMQIVVS